MKPRALIFIDATTVADEVLRLRRGYQRHGNWSLPQICWHLNMACRYSMKPPAEARPITRPDMQAKLHAILENKSLPEPITAPARAISPADTPDEAIDEFLATLTALHFFQGPFGPHLLFGTIPFEDFKQLHMIHCAHHLGFLTPSAA